MHICIRPYGIFNVAKLHLYSENKNVVQINLSDLERQLSEQVWDGTDEITGNYKYFSPLDILTNKVYESNHWNRIVNCELNYPLIAVDRSSLVNMFGNSPQMYYLYSSGDKYDILDGMHRLSKLYMLKSNTVNVKIMSVADLNKSKVGEIYDLNKGILFNKISRTKSGDYIYENNI